MKKMVLVDPSLLPPSPPTTTAPLPPSASSEGGSFTPPPPPPDATRVTGVGRAQWKDRTEARARLMDDMDRAMTDLVVAPSTTTTAPTPDADDEVVKRYGDLLGRYLLYGAKRRRSPPPPPAPTAPPTAPTLPTMKKPDATDQQVIDTVPARYKSKARRLMDLIKKKEGVIDWNRDNNRLMVRGKLISDTDITDLVNDVMRERKGVAPPIGWQTFASALKEINVPSELIGHRKRREWIASEQLQAASSSGGEKRASSSERRRAAASKRFRKWEKL